MTHSQACRGRGRRAEGESGRKTHTPWSPNFTALVCFPLPQTYTLSFSPSWVSGLLTDAGSLLAGWGSEFRGKWLGWWGCGHTQRLLPPLSGTTGHCEASNQPAVTRYFHIEPFLGWLCGLAQFAIRPLSPCWCLGWRRASKAAMLMSLSEAVF